LSTPSRTGYETVVTELSMTIYAGACRTVQTVGDRTLYSQQE